MGFPSVKARMAYFAKMKDKSGSQKQPNLSLPKEPSMMKPLPNEPKSPSLPKMAKFPRIKKFFKGK